MLWFSFVGFSFALIYLLLVSTIHRTTAKIWLVSICLSEAISILVAPEGKSDSIIKPYHKNLLSIIFPYFSSRDLVSLPCFSLFICGFSYEKYILICDPMRFDERVTIKRVALINIAIWLLVLTEVVGISLYYIFVVCNGYDHFMHSCVYEVSNFYFFSSFRELYLSAIYIFIPSALMVFFNIGIYKNLKKSQEFRQNQRVTDRQTRELNRRTKKENLFIKRLLFSNVFFITFLVPARIFSLLNSVLQSFRNSFTKELNYSYWYFCRYAFPATSDYRICALISYIFSSLQYFNSFLDFILFFGLDRDYLMMLQFWRRK